MQKGSPSDLQKRSPGGGIKTLEGMYQEYFLDYASYVILERAVPAIEDGLKPVQRSILFAMRQMDDGRYHKVANIIGQTMQYHPHGDAAIGDALVKLGQHDLMIDTQGNWGDTRTGDSAAASRYIEARLTRFALDVAFNKDTTHWQISYDGRKNEPINLPVKFPLLLAQGVEGIAVGLSTKIMPHNLGELIRASIKVLEGKSFKLYPDFPSGGSVDVSDYQQGKRGGKLKVRAQIDKRDKSTLVISQLPYGVTTGSLIESIVKANEKGKIKVKKIVDNTAQDVEIVIDLVPGVSPDLTIDALYAFTDCTQSVSPNACVIIDQKPVFTTVDEILRLSAEHTRQLLKWELEIKLADLEDKWHASSLEKIFIENRVYHDIEECESWEAVMETIDREMRRYIREPHEPARKGDERILLRRPFVHDDILALTEIKIKRISKYNSFKAEEYLVSLEQEIGQVKHELANLTDYTIRYFEGLYAKYAVQRPRKTIISSFDTIDVVQVAANNVKLYANLKEGFVGYGLKKEDEIRECSDLDDVIGIRKDGVFRVSKIGEKVFMGENLLYADVSRKGDDRTTYNVLYLDGETGQTRAKRFQITAVTRDKDYDITRGTKGSKILYLTANPNGESERVRLQLSPSCKAKIKVFEFDFNHLDIKGRTSQGNIVTKYPVRKIDQIMVGQSTLGAVQFWMDEVSGRLNKDGRGRLLGGFDTGDAIVAFYADGTYVLHPPDPVQRVEVNRLITVSKMSPDSVVAAVHFDGEKGWTMLKRFRIETSTPNERVLFIKDHPKSKLLLATVDANVEIQYGIADRNNKDTWSVNLDEFIDVKGWKAMGNKLNDRLINQIKVIDASQEDADADETSRFKPGDSIELDF